MSPIRILSLALVLSAPVSVLHAQSFGDPNIANEIAGGESIQACEDKEANASCSYVDNGMGSQYAVTITGTCQNVEVGYGGEQLQCKPE